MAKGEKQIKHTPEQKAELVEQICQLYESQNATIESCCDPFNITYRTFKKWLAENSELSERYKKAKEIQEEDYWENIIKPLQKRVLQKHLEVEFAQEYNEVVYQGVKVKDEFGQPVLQNSVKAILPNPSVLIFSLKGTYPDKFSDKHEISGKGGGPVKVDFDISKLSDKEADLLLDLMAKAKNE